MIRQNILFKGNFLKRATCMAVAVLSAASISACGGSAKKEEGNNSLTISVITKDRYLDMAISKFKEMHPDVAIDVKEYTSDPLPQVDGPNKSVVKVGEKPEDVEKYVNAVNTGLMSGKGTDIVLLDKLPYEKYADKNLLADLSKMIENDKDFDKDKYYSNVLDAVKYNGSLYGMPLSISVNMLTANKGVLDKYGVSIDDSSWDWEDFVEIAGKVIENSKKDGINDIYALSGMDEKALITSLVTNSYNKFVDEGKKSAGFDSREFIDLLNLSKSMIDNKLVNTDTSQGKMGDLAARGGALFSAGAIRTFMDLTMARQAFNDEVEYLKYPGEGSNLSFTANSVYGINNNSSNKELAWEFLKLLVSDEMMSQAQLMGLPVNKAAAEKAAQNAVEMSTRKGNKIMINGQTMSGVPVTREDVDYISNLLSKVNVSRGVDSKIISIVQEETGAFYTGQKTAEDTAKSIQSRVSTYINE